MLRKSFFMIFVFLFVVCLQQGIPVVSQIQQVNPEVRPFTDLTLEIAVSGQTLLPLQPIPIVIKQSNKTNQSALGYNSIVFGASPIN